MRILVSFRSPCDIPGKFVYLLKPSVRRDLLVSKSLCEVGLMDGFLDVVIVALQRQIQELSVPLDKLLAERCWSQQLPWSPSAMFFEDFLQQEAAFL